MIDELAALAGKDALEFRRSLLAGHARKLRTLDLAAEKAAWGSPMPSGRARGIAVHRSFDSVVAHVAEVSIVDGRPRVHRVVTAIDPGHVVSPDGVRSQMEGAVVWALSAALYGEITIKDGRTVEQNFDTYRVLRIGEMPKVECVLIPSGDFWGGVGEIGRSHV